MHTALALAALAVAALVFAQGTDNPAWEEANRELAWRVQEAVENDHENIERRDVAEVIDDSKSFLIGGNEDYKPYTVPCPQGVNWIRSARDVSCLIPLRS